MSANEILGYVTSMIDALGLRGFIQAMLVIFALLGFYHSFVRRDG